MDLTSLDAIDLPPPDQRATTAVENLQEAVVILHMQNGQNLKGGLKLLSYARENLLLETSDGPTLISFNKILYLSFSEKLPMAPHALLTAKIGNSELLPALFQKFKIVLKNNEIVTGKMKSSFLDGGGIHVFKLFDSKHMVRLFFPSTSVASYQLGDRMGEALADKQKVKSTAIDKALTLQKEARQKKLGDILVEAKAIKPEDLQNALKLQQKESGEITEAAPARKIGEILVAEQAIKQQDLDQFIADQHSSRGKKIGEYLNNLGATSPDDVSMELARKANLPFIKLASYKPEQDAIALVPQDIALKYQVMPLQIRHGHLLVALDDPLNPETLDTLQFITNLHLEMVVASASEITAAINRYYDEEKIHKDITEAESLQGIFKLDNKQQQDLLEMEQPNSGAPIVRLVAKFIVDAIRRKASDIHIRPKEESADLLFRIDGSLIKMRSFSKPLLNPIISRIKIIGNMDIAERRLPQDGGAQVSDRGSKVDLRISIIPTVEGESAVIRILNSQVGLKSIEELGFNEFDSNNFRDMMHKSYGLVLVTGPTGSGKSTTLYAALKEVIARNLNIITVENPVEFHIDGIEQIQVNTVPGYTFARALRHILRHDPDVIMIGEIRDEETGKIAVESALTGHLVLSTLHTNDAAGAITRLLEMGVDPFLLNGTLLGIFAQRLVKKNCEACLDKEHVDSGVRKALKVEESEPFYKGQGCEKCRGTGYSGRMAAYELLQFSPGLRKIIHAQITTQEVHEQAVLDGMVPLTQNALALARAKKTSLEEVYRVRLE